MTAKTKTKALAELDSMARLITPWKLQGEKRELWNDLVRRYRKHEMAGATWADMFKWAKKHLGINCSLACFRRSLQRASQ